MMYTDSPAAPAPGIPSPDHVEEEYPDLNELASIQLQAAPYNLNGQTEIGFIPREYGVVVHTPPVERTTESGITLEMADSLDASLPLRGRIVAIGPYVDDEYGVGTEVLVRRYTGIQLEVDGDRDYWFFELDQLLGRFPGTRQEAP